MNSLILRIAANTVAPVILVFSVVMLLRGHNEPGGGFVGGLIAASAFALLAISHSLADARRMLGVNPRLLIGAGLVLATLSGVPGMLGASAFLEGVWVSISVPGFPEPLKAGTPLLFDLGVYFVVIGVSLTLVFSLEEARS